jgi:hypothetical protein
MNTMTPESLKKLTPTELAERLRPKHLEDVTAADLAEEIERETQGPEPQTSEGQTEKDPRGRNPYTFDLDWTDPRGQRWQGRFVTHMPTPMDLMRAGVMQARLLGSTPRESVDAFTEEIAYIISRLSFVLDERPDWFVDPLSMVDAVPLLQQIYGEVASFEAFFRRHGQIEGASSTQSGKQ